MAPQVVVMAGPNGSGKSTCAELLVATSMAFVNADNLAQELTGLQSTTANLQAGRRLLEIVGELSQARKSFALETTLATKKLAPRLIELKDQGYEAHMVFLYLPSADLAVERVAARVRAGGHDVPEQTIRRRYEKGLTYFFQKYLDVVDSWGLYDNSKIASPRLVAFRNEHGLEIRDQDLFSRLQELWGTHAQA